jgi:hypothetical protein
VQEYVSYALKERPAGISRRWAAPSVAVLIVSDVASREVHYCRLREQPFISRSDKRLPSQGSGVERVVSKPNTTWTTVRVPEHASERLFLSYELRQGGVEFRYAADGELDGGKQLHSIALLIVAAVAVFF